MSQVSGILLGNPIKLTQLRASTQPLFAIDWAERLFALVGQGDVRILMRRLRGSPLHRNEYILIRDRLLLSVTHPGQSLPDEWITWRALIAKYNLFQRAETRR